MGTQSFFIAGTLPFILLGAMHIIYTLIDIRLPSRFAPYKDEVRLSMLSSTLMVTRQTNMWRAWVGLNISHGLGTLFFGLTYFCIAEFDIELLTRVPPMLYLAPCMALCYVILSIKYWFNVPAIGASIGLACFVAGVVVS
jgi:hypothetical protein